MSRDSVSILMSEQTIIDKLHNDKPITKIVISPKDEYLVTYSKEDDSIHGWNIKENGQQQPDVYFKLDKDYDISSYVLYKKILVFSYGCKYLFWQKIKQIIILYLI